MSLYRIMLVMLLCALPLSGCARPPLNGRADAMRLAEPPAVTAERADDLPLATLTAALEEQIRFMEGKNGPELFQFGEREFSKKEYLNGLRRAAELARRSATPGEFYRRISAEFDFYEVYGRDDWGEVFLTSYFEPLIPGSLKRSERFRQPLYAKPADLVQVRLKDFVQTAGKQRVLHGRVENGRLLPYYSRKQIDGEGALAGRGLELCWVDPVDAFFLQVQGSGTVVLENGEKLRINYAAKNGHPYRPVGSVFKEQIPASLFNLHTIEQKLRSLSPEAMQVAMNINPSYVFFKLYDKSAVTYMGLPATDGRTIATDQRYFQKGLLGFLLFDKPQFSGADAVQPEGFAPAARFVLDQDIGGAITGGGRVDLFWGRGAAAKQAAGVIKHKARLYYLAPKKLAPSEN